MASTVYWAKLTIKNPADNKLAKIRRICKAVGLEEHVKPFEVAPEDQVVAVKVHFGERGNDTYVHPTFVREVVDQVRACGAKPFLTDTCTLYKACRHNGVDHLETAYLHGFTPYVVNAPVVIADGVNSHAWREVPINLKHFQSVKIADGILSANAMVVLSHFKGHAFGGFGGALKNLAMGCAPHEGKIDQHGRNIVIMDNCIGCGQCVKICPQQALSLVKVEKGRRCVIDKERCFGCYECMSVCKQGAIGIDLPNEHADFSERMVEYAYGALKGKEGRLVFINFLMNITPQCDCAGWSDPVLVPDIGILASLDPVALDTACFDLVKDTPSLRKIGEHDCHSTGYDKFQAEHPNTRGYHQVEYAESIGMGSREYELVNV
ncbi:MAG: DUF362 domain-containing protein [Desulfovibrionaceae bacterium]|nr:DUF362 domain-containing protein [Desulfovibrionaceae bacterium]